MTGGALPFVLMFAAVGLLLAAVPSKVAWLCIACVALSALIFALPATYETVRDVIVAGFWLSLITTGIAAFFGNGVPQWLAIGIAINAGAWSGALGAASNMRDALIFALPISFLFVLGRWVSQRGFGLLPRILSSWLIAVAALAMFASLTPSPNYKGDHME